MQINESEDREEELESLIEHLKNLKDDRDDYRLDHKLIEVLFVVICAQLNGFETFKEYVLYAKEKMDFLKKFFEYKHGHPSRSTIYRVLALIDPKKLECVLETWMKQCIKPNEQQVIAIDGKAHRGNQAEESIHLVGAFATSNGLLVGQERVSDKSNEITAIPELIDRLSIKNQIITIDAMGCQKNIAAQIAKKGADYILALKANHKNLHDDIALYFNDPCSGDNISFSETLEKSRGRVEHRKCFATQNTDWLEDKAQWKNLKTIVKMESNVHKKGKETKEVRYFLTSLIADSELILKSVRSHWFIENNLHWLLDVVFKEDNRVLWNKNVIQNEAMIRRFALNLIRKYKTKFNDNRAIKSLRKILMNNNAIMENILHEF